MKGKLKHSLRFVLVTVGIVGLTTFTIDATDTLRGSQSALSILADRATEGECPRGMSKVADFDFCIDTFEASPGSACPHQTPTNVRQTAQNNNDPDCIAESKVAAMPWTNITKTQAEAVCAKSGKRLPTAAEWYQASLGTPDTGSACNTEGVLREASAEQCQAGAGAYDMIGNAWEMVSGTVEDGTYNELPLPPEGYVATLDESGLPRTTTTTPQVIYNDDYFWSKAEGTYVLVRGGFYGSGSDSGIYSSHAAIEQNFSSDAIGFRCALSL